MLLRIESGKVDPTFGMLRRLLEAAGQDLHLRSTRRSPSQRGRVLAELADAWVELPDEHPDWTKLRLFLDDLASQQFIRKGRHAALRAAFAAVCRAGVAADLLSP